MMKGKYFSLEKISVEECSRKHQVLVKMVMERVGDKWQGYSFVTVPPGFCLVAGVTVFSEWSSQLTLIRVTFNTTSQYFDMKLEICVN